MEKDLNELLIEIDEMKKQATKKKVSSALADDHRSLGYAEGVEAMCAMIIEEINKIINGTN